MKILNFGSLNIDYTYRVDHFVRGGETLSSHGLETYTGGKGLNQSIALSKSGSEVWHAGAVGEADGGFLLEALEAAGVHTELVARTGGKTGHAIIQKAVDGGNCILLYGGANQAITREQVDRVLEGFAAGDYLVLQNEINEIGYIMEQAHQKGMVLVLNPSPMDGKITGYPLDYVDCFLLNEIEAEDICGRHGMEGEQLLKQLAGRFPKARIVLTLGGDGAMYWDGERMFRQGIYQVEAADTTAAGDTFTGYFITAVSKGMTPQEALDLAARAAAIAVSRPGAAPSIPDREEVERFHGHLA